MIEALLPKRVMSAVARQDDRLTYLFPEELADLGGAVESRLLEFRTARVCAREAMRRLGLLPVPILRGPNREPIWPSGVVGSITHCDGFRAAAVARTSDVAAIGIDAEPHDLLPAEVHRLVVLREEEAQFDGAQAGFHWDRVLFSAKESVFKAWYPLKRKWLDFNDVIVTLSPSEGEFHAVFRRGISDPRCKPICGRFLVSDGLVLTAVILPVEAPDLGLSIAPVERPSLRSVRR
jgi:4'-phosphopantetheinyl transferase EntD